MKRLASLACGPMTASVAATGLAAEGPVPTGIAHLDHVFVIMMENHSYGQVIGNPAMPYINAQIKNGKVNLATNYFAVGHPSLTNYLEIVGGSNFGVRSDNTPDWHNHNCKTNLQTGIPNADNDLGTAPYPIDTDNICPISGTGTDAVTEAVDTWNETSARRCSTIWPTSTASSRCRPPKTPPARRSPTSSRAVGLSWKSLPGEPADRRCRQRRPQQRHRHRPDDLQCERAAVGHEPAAPDLRRACCMPTRSSITRSPTSAASRKATTRNNSLRNMVGFDGANGLYADLATGHVPSLAFIAPNQCDDQHGEDNGDAFCQADQGVTAFQGLTDGTQLGLNPGLSANADTTVQRIVTAIKDRRLARRRLQRDRRRV